MLPTLFLNHGGGPLPLLNDPAHKSLITYLKGLNKSFPKPTAIVVASAHWEESIPTWLGSDEPSLLYDYNGFPKEAYDIHYPAKNSPEILTEPRSLLAKAGIQTKLDMKRDYDYGVFVPLMFMYPNADIPIVQISLLLSPDPVAVYNIGKAVKPLREHGVLIIGSALSFHNLSAFFSNIPYKKFNSELFDTALREEMLSNDRKRELFNWESFPQDRFSHPQEDHFMPLLFVAGAGEHIINGREIFWVVHISTVPLNSSKYENSLMSYHCVHYRIGMIF